MITCTFENGNDASLRHVVTSVILLRDGQILLERRAKQLLEAGKWGLPGGFMDRDETLIQAAERETLEETGWTMKDIRLFRVVDTPNSRGEDRQNVKFVYVATADIQMRAADAESDEIRWFPLNKLPPDEEMAFDHAELIAQYRKAPLLNRTSHPNVKALEKDIKNSLL